MFYKEISEFMMPKSKNMQECLRWQCFRYFQDLLESKKGEVTIFTANIGNAPLFATSSDDWREITAFFSNPVFSTVYQVPSLGKLKPFLPEKEVYDDIEKLVETVDLDFVRIGLVIYACQSDRSALITLYPLDVLKKEVASFVMR